MTTPPQGQYQAYLQTPHWHEVRDRALDYAEHACQLCNSTNGLQVHHRTYERIGRERPADLTVLCRACHEKHHDRVGGYAPVKGFTADEKAVMAAHKARLFAKTEGD